MEDEQTQPATQQMLDPRRLGHNGSGLDDKDVADVLAILHPTSPGAYKIVEDAAERRPQHVKFHNPYDSYDDEFANIEEQETIIIDRPSHRSLPPSKKGNDLALRMSSRLMNPSLGFVFGRNAGSSDIIFGQDSGKRISNQHFRIFINSNGILMLEDMSTNGTVVDDVLLKNRDPKFSKTRTLSSGSIICVHSNQDAEMIKFMVQIPSRVTHLDRFQENMRAFLAKCAVDADTGKVWHRLNKQKFGASMKWDGGVHYNFIGQLGKGAFATVYQLATKMEGKLLAAKELEKRRFMKNGQLDKKIDNEMKIMQELRHPNIVEFVEYHDEGDYLYIIMEYVRHGDLQGYLGQQGRLEESDARLMAQQILSALNYLHRMKITHRDIKPDNILIADLNPLTVKLSDFGLSKVVKHEETFLKTFCGTLLYCAPEVFPDYDGSKAAKGTKRRRGAKQQFHSYSSSVDIWSFAGVLWYALCGKPPFEGIADATGHAMYTNIMTTALDPTPLREAKVSDPCIDLLCRMLRTDPSMRPTDRECLSHPWLREGITIPQDPILQSIVEEEEAEIAGENLSQLSLHEDEIAESEQEDEDFLEEDDEFEALINDRQSKKIRIDTLIPRNQPRDADHDSSANLSFVSQRYFGNGNQADESFHPMPEPPGRARLFGEIGQSALQSSGILSLHARDALSDVPSSNEVVPDHVLPDRVPGTSRTGSDGLQRNPSVQPPTNNHPSFSSPSLLGTEAMVRELNMASPPSSGSGAHSPNEPATPKTPELHQHNSLDNNSHRTSQLSEATPKAKESAFDRRINLPKTASYYYRPGEPETHNLEFASKESGVDYVAAAAQISDVNTAEIPDTIRISPQPETPQPTVSATADAIPGMPAQPDIKPPPRRLGKLIATPDSFSPNLTVAIDQSSTSWGRLPTNTVVYEHSRDTRIPKTAFFIFWYTPDSESTTVEQLSQQGEDWTKIDGLRVGIFTCATSGIGINGKHLRQKDERGRALFGDLHTGDIIQVYQDSRGSECLKFKCEFYQGTGKESRAAGESFGIQSGGKLGG